MVCASYHKTYQNFINYHELYILSRYYGYRLCKCVSVIFCSVIDIFPSFHDMQKSMEFSLPIHYLLFTATTLLSYINKYQY